MADAIEQCRVQVWFGSHVICSHRTDVERAKRYAALLTQRYAGLRVTIDDALAVDDPDLPHELLWERTVR